MTENPASPVENTARARAYKRRARNILIHKPMQKEFTLVLIGLLMVSLLAISFVIHSTIREAVLGGGYSFGKISPVELLSDISYQLIVRVASVLFVTLIIVGLFGVSFLHRVAGPVYRFRQTFLKLNRGEMPPAIRLREGDFFDETAQEINKYLETVRGSHPPKN